MLEVTGKEEAKLGKWKAAAFYYFIFFHSFLFKALTELRVAVGSSGKREVCVRLQNIFQSK